MCPWDQASMVKMYFCFCQVTYWPLATIKLDKSLHRMQKPKCLLSYSEEPPFLDLHTTHALRWNKSPRSTKWHWTFCAHHLWIINDMKTEHWELTDLYKREYYKSHEAHLRGWLPEEDEASISCFKPVTIKWRVSLFKYQQGANEQYNALDKQPWWPPERDREIIGM